MYNLLERVSLTNRRWMEFLFCGVGVWKVFFEFFSESEDPFELSLPFCVEKGKIDCNISLVLGLFRDNSFWPIRAAEILLPDSDWISRFD